MARSHRQGKPRRQRIALRDRTLLRVLSQGDSGDMQERSRSALAGTEVADVMMEVLRGGLRGDFQAT
jgi:hypothetical protein